MSARADLQMERYADNLRQSIQIAKEEAGAANTDTSLANPSQDAAKVNGAAGHMAGSKGLTAVSVLVCVLQQLLR